MMSKTFGVILLVAAGATFMMASRPLVEESRRRLRLREGSLEEPPLSIRQHVALSVVLFAITVAEIWFSLILLR